MILDLPRFPPQIEALTLLAFLPILGRDFVGREDIPSPIEAEAVHRGCSSMGERSVRIRKVGGSSPLSSTTVTSWEAPVSVVGKGFFCLKNFSFHIPRTIQRGQVLCNGTLPNPARSGRKQRSAICFV